MPKNLTSKILQAHLVEGELKPGCEISIRIDHTPLPDAPVQWPCWSLTPWGCRGACYAEFCEKN